VRSGEFELKYSDALTVVHQPLVNSPFFWWGTC
jgi:hypothetical protein